MGLGILVFFLGGVYGNVPWFPPSSWLLGCLRFLILGFGCVACLGFWGFDVIVLGFERVSWALGPGLELIRVCFLGSCILRINPITVLCGAEMKLKNNPCALKPQTLRPKSYTRKPETLNLKPFCLCCLSLIGRRRLGRSCPQSVRQRSGCSRRYYSIGCLLCGLQKRLQHYECA